MKTASQTTAHMDRQITRLAKRKTYFVRNNRSVFTVLGRISMAFVLLMFVIQASTAAFASTRDAADDAVDIVHSLTDIGALSGPEEVKKVEGIWTEYFTEHPPRTFSYGVGQTYFDGQFPVESFAPGTVGDFTFDFINTDTLQQEFGGPTIGYVLYEMSPHVGQAYVPIGISNNAADNFAFSYVMPQGEPSFEGIPYDTTGNPIVFTDFDGSGNVAVGEYFNIPTPEPASLALVGSGVLGLAGVLRRRLHTQS